MGYVVKKTESSYPTVEPGSYAACVDSIKEQECSKHGKTWTSWKVYFKIIEEGEYEGGKVSGLVTPILSPGSKLDQWLTVLGIEVPVEEEFDTDTMIGATCLIIVAQTHDGDKIYSNVSTITKLKQNKVNPIPVAKPVEVPKTVVIPEVKMVKASEIKPVAKPIVKTEPVVTKPKMNAEDIPF
jgi:hypothetical protein